jgi:branched-chain amino acid transport system permease protein
VGGYTAAILSIAYDWGPLKTLPVALLITMVSAILFCPLVIVARGLYYVLLTLLLPLVFLEVTFIFTDLFKGDVGLSGVKLLVDLGYVKLNFLTVAYLSMFMMLIFLLAVNKIIKSRYGLIMATINDDEEVAHGIGVNINLVKILSFLVPAGMIGIVGWFYAHYFGTFAGITYLPLSFMVKVLLVIFIGGRTQVFGCVVGGYFVAFLEMILISTLGPIQPVVFPVILFVLLFALPEGLFGLYRKRRYREYLPTLHVRR